MWTEVLDITGLLVYADAGVQDRFRLNLASELCLALLYSLEDQLHEAVQSNMPGVG